MKLSCQGKRERRQLIERCHYILEMGGAPVWSPAWHFSRLLSDCCLHLPLVEMPDAAFFCRVKYVTEVPAWLSA
ncbi:MAG: hypothetical protein DMG90_18485 [Acidobacteria bacterium]|jgi:hypothetical protein|nr:MAG: hypothetical protein DMG90_18485 [Acidobacteriota bacterium]